jgi:hypothetical protein
LCDEGSCAPQVLAAKVSPVAIGINSSAVFWIETKRTAKCPKTGCVGAPIDLALGTLVTTNRGPRQMFVDEDAVYWLGAATDLNSSLIYSCATAGCFKVPTTIGEASKPGELVGSATSILRYDGTGSISSFTLSGGGPVYLSKLYIESSLAFALDGDSLAFANIDASPQGHAGVYVGSIAAGVYPTRLMDTGRQVAIGGGVVYASQTAGPAMSVLVACPVGGCAGTGAPVAPGAPPEATITDIAVAPGAIYWTAGEKVRGCTLPGCPGGPRTLADKQPSPIALAVDESFVYWANAGTGLPATGSIVRVRR